jgi:predicted ATPase/class 3 adenylate cyclase
LPTIPSGTITFLFTDIEGSTRLWEQHPAQMQIALSRHDTLLKQAIEQNNGYVFKTVGDAFCAAFSTAKAALLSTISIQQALATEPWPAEIGQIRVRMGLHTGVAQEREGDYFGQTLNRVARLQGVAYGGQVLLSGVTRDLVSSLLPDGCSLLDLGEHRLKDLGNPEQLSQLIIPGLPSEFPPLKTIGKYPNNLPLPTTSFIGRKIEIGEVKELFEFSRMVTLVGVGGTGKTRLSQAVAHEMLTGYKDGVWLVELAPLTDHTLVTQAVAQVLKVNEKPGQPLLTTLLEKLKTSQSLLLLDNCEHLIGSCAKLSAELLANCPNLKILATSREGLSVRGERLYQVPSLEVPPAGSQTQPLSSPENLTKYEAVRLFVERTQAVSAQFQLNERNGKAVGEICRRLDGIPLALELAAVRVKALPVEQLAVRLKDRFRLLTGGNRTDLPRQQTLRALIDWSYDLLNAQEQVLWQRLSVFAGGWTLEAAEQVCNGEPLEEWEVLDLFSQLVEKSLVVVEEEESGETRYRMLETIRQYGWEKLLELGDIEVQKVQAHYADYFLILAEELQPKLVSEEHIAALEQLDSEYDNLRAGLEWAISRGDCSIALKMCTALGRFWGIRGYWSEGREYLTKGLELAVDSQTIEKAKVLSLVGSIAIDQGEIPVSQRYFEESLGIFREIGDKQGIASTLNSLGFVVYYEGKYSVASGYFEESLRIYREIGDTRGIAGNLSGLGVIAYNREDNAQARRYHEESLGIFRGLRDKAGIAYCLDYLGAIATSQGEYSIARSFLEESLTFKRESGDKQGIAKSLFFLGAVVSKQNEYQAARLCFEECLNISRELGDKYGIIAGLVGLLNLINIAGKAEDEKVSRGNYPVVLARLGGAVATLRGYIGFALVKPISDYYEEAMEDSRAGLGEEAFNAAFAEGQAMNSETAIELALECIK